MMDTATALNLTIWMLVGIIAADMCFNIYRWVSIANMEKREKDPNDAGPTVVEACEVNHEPVEIVLAVDDRVRYYGTMNEWLEVATATVLEIGNKGLVKIRLDSYRNGDGDMVTGPVTQYAHRKQLRKLKPKQCIYHDTDDCKNDCAYPRCFKTESEGGILPNPETNSSPEDRKEPVQ